jgi:hypothetical protein
MLLAFALAATAALPQDPYRIPLEGEESGTPVARFDQAALDAKLAEILPRLEEIRGWKFSTPVTAGIQSVAEFMAYAERSMAEEWSPDQLAGKMASAILLGFLPEDQDFASVMRALLEAAVGGYYDPQTRKFWLIEGFAGGPLADVLMAHELQHALDDQHHPLEEMLGGAEHNGDVGFALRSVVEGSATSAMNLYMIRAMREGWLPPGDLLSADMMFAQMKAMEKSPVAMVAGMMLPYLEGNIFLVRGGGLIEAVTKTPAEEDLQRAFRAPPQSSEQILHPEKYWDAEHADPPHAVTLPDRSAALGEGWRCVDEDTLGELGCAFLAVPRLPSPLELQFGAMGLRHPASAGWGGDRYRSYLRADGARILHALTVWDSAADAAEFAAALEDPRARARVPRLFRIRLDGARVELIFADAAAQDAAQRLTSAR